MLLMATFSQHRYDYFQVCVIFCSIPITTTSSMRRQSQDVVIFYIVKWKHVTIWSMQFYVSVHNVLRNLRTLWHILGMLENLGAEMTLGICISCQHLTFSFWNRCPTCWTVPFFTNRYFVGFGKRKVSLSMVSWDLITQPSLTPAPV